MSNILDWEETGKLMDYRYGFNVYHYINPVKVPELSPKIEKKPEKTPVEDDFDLFGDDTTASKPVVKKPEAKPKKNVVAKSIIIFDVKVFEEEQDLQALAKKVLEIQMDGLVWRQDFQLLPVAYGMKKLQMGCVVEDDKVMTDDLFEKIQAWEDEVQSVDVVSFQKL